MPALAPAIVRVADDSSATSAEQYLTDSAYTTPGAWRVCNELTRFDYQSLGYFVSHIAEARDHCISPTVRDLLDPMGVRPSSARSLPTRRLGMLCDPTETLPPSNTPALQRFAVAARRFGFEVEMLRVEDCTDLSRFSALFFRTTTRATDASFQLACRAERAGLAVIDDPNSILRGCNKAFLAERLRCAGIPTPQSLLLHRGNVDTAEKHLGFPLVLKTPDGFSSHGVLRVTDNAEIQQATGALFKRSDILIAQEYLPTAFDWRIGVLDRKALFACKYHMVKRHWQIIKRDGEILRDTGYTNAVALEAAPAAVVKLAVAAANAVGDGFYGVDLKVIGDRAYVLEVNDNPTIDAGCEDAVLRSALYDAVMQSFVRRVARLGHTPPKQFIDVRHRRAQR